MKKIHNIFAAVAVSAAFLATSCEVEQTQEGKLPEVDVDVDAKPGQLPKFDVETPEVDVGVKTKKVEVEVPDVDVDVKLPKDKDGE